MAKKKTTTRKNESTSRSTARKTTRGGTSARQKSTTSKTTSTKSKNGSDKPSSPRKTSSRKTTSRSKTQPRPGMSFHQKLLISGIFVSFLAFLLLLSLIWPNQGELPANLFNILSIWFGWGRYLIPVLMVSVGLYLVFWGMEQRPSLPTIRLAGLGVLLLVGEAFASLFILMRNSGFTDLWQVGSAGRGGGYLGSTIAFAFTKIGGNLGAIFLLVIVALAGAVLFTGATRQEIMEFWAQLRGTPETAVAPAPTPAKRNIRINPGRQTPTPVQLPLPETADPTPEPPTTAEPTPATPQPPPEPVRPRLLRRHKQEEPTPSPPPEPAAPTPIFLGSTPAHNWKLPVLADLLESGTDTDLNNIAIREQVEIIEHTLDSFGAPATVVEINQGPTIVQFGVEPNYIQARSGKRTKVKVGKVASLADDLALALAAKSIRIQAPVPGKGYIGIEVPTPAKALVSLRDVMETAEFQKIKSPLRIGLGQNVAGQPISADLAAMPHVLIAGTTGSGKSVCVNGIIACLLLQNTPEQLKLVMVDPKRVELTGYNGIPHLAAPVVVEIDRVVGVLQWAQREMDKRYQAFAEVGARNIIDYNKKIEKKENVSALPYIVIIIDELADLMMLAPEDTERAITRLAQMARATGIHMVIATQRPSVDVVTGLIKANFPARIAFAVASSTDSRVVLDTTGAERLLGQGDMLFQSPDAASPVRLQGCYVSPEELDKLIAYWQTARRFNLVPASTATSASSLPSAARITAPTPEPPDDEAPAPEPAVTRPPTPRRKREPLATAPSPATAVPQPEANVVAETAVTSPTPTPEPPAQQPLWEEMQKIAEEQEDELEDDLLPEAIELVRQLNKASTSLLQRRFRIGYTRAARLMDYMEDKGIIGPPTGTSKAREVILDGDEVKSDESDEPLEFPDVTEE
ncbi:MAG: DNA translocase FtsK 4TM domain-containing protein [Ardenticatenaceae bacterium]|nr:DNA translocase FtsK 4TM domain-containing protein [Ardenticatenaceae bacterium]